MYWKVYFWTSSTHLHNKKIHFIFHASHFTRLNWLSKKNIHISLWMEKVLLKCLRCILFLKNIWNSPKPTPNLLFLHYLKFLEDSRHCLLDKGLIHINTTLSTFFSRILFELMIMNTESLRFYKQISQGILCPH